METDYKKDLLIITEYEMEMVKENALKLLEVLPDEPMTALITINYLKNVMEGRIGRKIEQLKVVYKEDKS